MSKGVEGGVDREVVSDQQAIDVARRLIEGVRVIRNRKDVTIELIPGVARFRWGVILVRFKIGGRVDGAQAHSLSRVVFHELGLAGFMATGGIGDIEVVLTEEAIRSNAASFEAASSGAGGAQELEQGGNEAVQGAVQASLSYCLDEGGVRLVEDPDEDGKDVDW